MRVQRVLMPGTDFESWTVLGEDHRPVEPVERFLSYLASIEKSRALLGTSGAEVSNNATVRNRPDTATPRGHRQIRCTTDMRTDK